MVTVEYKIIHAIPGRIRLRVPRLRQDNHYALTVQGLLEALEPVIETRVSPINQSLIVQYQRYSLSEVQLQQQFQMSHVAVRLTVKSTVNATLLNVL